MHHGLFRDHAFETPATFHIVAKVTGQYSVFFFFCFVFVFFSSKSNDGE